jgi:hypothetical protein
MSKNVNLLWFPFWNIWQKGGFDVCYRTKTILNRTIIVFTSICSDQPVKLITLASLDLVQQVYVHVEILIILLISFDILVEPVFLLLLKITIPFKFDTFKEHLVMS